MIDDHEKSPISVSWSDGLMVFFCGRNRGFSAMTSIFQESTFSYDSYQKRHRGTITVQIGYDVLTIEELHTCLETQTKAMQYAANPDLALTGCT